MPRVLLLLPTTTYRAEALLSAARHLGVAVTIASEEPSTLEHANPGGLLTLDFRDPERAARKAVEFARTYPIDAVVPVDEDTAVVAASISAALSLRHNSIESALAARNKHRMRERLSEAGVRIPSYRLFSIKDDPSKLARHVRYPCVIKPLILSSSRGVIRADDAGQFVTAFQRVAAILRLPEVARRGTAAGQVLVEDFVPGREVALEGLLAGGALRLLALFDKPDPLDGPFFEETIYVTPSRLPAHTQSDMVACAQQATRALGLTEGPVHAELRVNREGPWVIEIAARSIGGRCSRTLRFGTGLTLEELTLSHALGIPIHSMERERLAAGVMMIPIPQAGILNEVSGLEEAKNVSGVEEISITVALGRRVVPLPEGSAYLGFIFARGDTPEFVESALREAHRRLRFVIAQEAVDG